MPLLDVEVGLTQEPRTEEDEERVANGNAGEEESFVADGQLACGRPASHRLGKATTSLGHQWVEFRCAPIDPLEVFPRIALGKVT